MGKPVFLPRIWRVWLANQRLAEADHFVTNNAYMCVELNAHLLTNTIWNVIKGIFPPECLRVWKSGSQSCEQLFRNLRSMTPTLSTIVNFSLKGMVEKIRKIQFISYAKADETIVFPRVKRRLLQIHEETAETFSLPTENDMTKTILKAKLEIIRR